MLKIFLCYPQNVFFTYNSNCTKGHKYKLYKPSVRTDCRKFSFSNRVIDLWNNLPPNIVECTTLECFKKIIEKILWFVLNTDTVMNLFIIVIFNCLIIFVWLVTVFVTTALLFAVLLLVLLMIFFMPLHLLVLDRLLLLLLNRLN